MGSDTPPSSAIEENRNIMDHHPLFSEKRETQNMTQYASL
jgi:hypothetical protein